MRLRKRTAALTGLAAACSVAIVVVATGSAWSNDAPDLSDVATANTRSDGYAPASKLSVELRQDVVPRVRPSSRTRSHRRVATTATTTTCSTRPASRRCSRRPPSPTEAHKTEPDKNTYLVFKHGLSGADPSLRLRDALPLPGPRGAARPAYITRINLDADARAPGDADGDEGRDRRPDRHDRRLDVGSVGAAAAAHDGEPRRRRPTRRPPTIRRRSRTSPARSAAAATRASRTTTTATSGSSRTSAAPNKAGTTAKLPNSFVYRYVPRHRVTSTTVSCRCCRC